MTTEYVSALATALAFYDTETLANLLETNANYQDAWRQAVDEVGDNFRNAFTEELENALEAPRFTGTPLDTPTELDSLLEAQTTRQLEIFDTYRMRLDPSTFREVGYPASWTLTIDGRNDLKLKRRRGWDSVITETFTNVYVLREFLFRCVPAIPFHADNSMEDFFANKRAYVYFNRIGEPL